MSKKGVVPPVCKAGPGRRACQQADALVACGGPVVTVMHRANAAIDLLLQ